MTQGRYNCITHRSMLKIDFKRAYKMEPSFTDSVINETLRLQYPNTMEGPFTNPDYVAPKYNKPLKVFLEEEKCIFLKKIITNCGIRVVRLNLNSPGGINQPLGCGILFRMGKKVYIQTCEHVVKDLSVSDKLDNIVVDFEDDRLPTADAIDHCWGGCKKQDRAILLLQTYPGRLRKSDAIPDIKPFVVDIKVGEINLHQPFKGLIEYHSSQHGFVVHALKLQTPPGLDADTTVTCKFLIDNSSTTCSMRDVCYCSETGCAIIFVGNDTIPTKAREMFKDRSWLEDINNPLVYVISYPNPDSRLKYISIGGLYEGVRDENSHLNYNKRTDKVSLEIEYSGRRGPPHIPRIYYTDFNGDIHPYTEDERGGVNSEGGNSTNRVKNIFRTDSKGNMFYLQMDYSTQRLYKIDNNAISKQNVVFAHNDAETTNGSSGGCVLIIGPDKSQPNKYKHIINMHYGKSIQDPINKSLMYDYCGE
ncbi:uncharacterized protein LOC126823962 [Patella vulgata]|uniref:uncharacterized protein LOC126823962 n=1 Tax=Patella vulgata TaxID=6465 RepID=UPI00218070C6|nr:uncharacterized protein LOC126823962 [Patella vulgata]